MLNKLYFTLAFFSFFMTSAQTKDGFWDNVRTTNETITLRAGEKKFIKTANFPEGTTEVVYRITLLDDNQKISGSLVSVLKAIPDPTGISQGTAGAVFLASTIAGDDKCKYAIYHNSKDAESYVKSGKTIGACFVQDEPVNKDAKLLSANSKCLYGNVESLYFSFESDNWVMNQKIVLEVVPWVNIKASCGWNAATKKELVAIAEKQDVALYLSNKDKFYALFIENFSNKFKYSEFKQLLSVERNNAIETVIEESLKKSGEIDKYYRSITDKSLNLFRNGKIEEAIDLIQTQMIAKNRATYREYEVLGSYYLVTKQFLKAEEAFNQGFKLNPTEIKLQLDLAHTYMFTNRLSESKNIHKQFFNQNLSNGKTWVSQVTEDFKEFEKMGLPTDNFKKILRIID